MKLSDWKKVGRDYTERASNISRSLVLSGIAIIWVIVESDDSIKLSEPLLFWAVLLLGLAIFLDFLHYLIAGIIWTTFYNVKHKEGVRADEDITPKGPLRRRTVYFFYYTKFIVMFVAYLLVFISVIKYLAS